MTDVGKAENVIAGGSPLDEVLALYASGDLTAAEARCLDIVASNADSFEAAHVLGVVQYARGKRESALASYDRAISLWPGGAAAFSNRGVVLKEMKRFDEALASFDSALAIDPRFAEAHNNRGNVLKELGRNEAALASYDRALAMKPDYPRAIRNRGQILLVLRRLEEALECFDRAVRSRADFADAHFDRGLVLSELERFDDALASYDRTIALKPNAVDAHANRALVLRALKRFEEALASCDRAIELAPGFTNAHINRGLVLVHLKRFAEALASQDTAIALAPNSAKPHNGRAHALYKLGRREEALASCDRALALDPSFAEAHRNRGLVLSEMRRFEEALESLDRAISLAPGVAEVHNARGNVLLELRRPEEAISSCDEAIRIDPLNADANGNQSFALLLLGRFERGWKQYEWRKRLDEPIGNPSHPGPVWTGAEPIAGARLLIHAEQGLGDTIQFCRYATLARVRGAHVVLAVQPPLVRLLRQLDTAIDVVSEDAPPPTFDFHCALMSLPMAFGTNALNIPARTSYLRAEPSRREDWRRRIGGELWKVGVCWRGSVIGANLRKSFPVDCFRAVSRIPGVRLISLQKGDGAEALESASGDLRIQSFGDELDSGPDAFLDTAAIMECLDLVITTDTSIAHLAGALGVPTWVALKHVPDWRWGLEGRGTPWYPSMRLFRQKVRDDWSGVFDEIEQELRELVDGPRDPPP